MGTKEHPSQFDCYAKAQPDEPMFVLLARDPLASALVRLWADLSDNRSTPKKITEARQVAEDMDKWQAAHETKGNGETENMRNETKE